jgi:hypothetical protein
MATKKSQHVSWDVAMTAGVCMGDMRYGRALDSGDAQLVADYQSAVPAKWPDHAYERFYVD